MSQDFDNDRKIPRIFHNLAKTDSTTLMIYFALDYYTFSALK